MEQIKFGKKLMVLEHLQSGEPLTALEALTLYGVQNLRSEATRLRGAGWNIQKRTIFYAEALRRLNQHISISAPKNLPTREIVITEYWLSK